MIGIQTWLLSWAIVATLLLVAWGIGTMWQDGSRELRKALIGALVLIAAMIAAWAAFAHDHKHPERNDYLKSLHSKNKTWCCNGDDYDSFDDWETKDGGYRVKFRGQWFDVPDGALIDGPNEVGVPMLWMNKGFSGLSVRCFMPGPLT